VGISFDLRLVDAKLVVLGAPEEAGKARPLAQFADELVTALSRPGAGSLDACVQVGDELLAHNLVASAGFGIHTDTEALRACS